MQEIEIKKSRFISYAFEVKSSQEVLKIYQNFKEVEHKRSKHVCYAYRINENGRLNEKGFDDKEPAKSAGLPLLDLLRKRNDTDIAVFVVRYFGGILLGRSKLPGAYVKCASLALNELKK